MWEEYLNNYNSEWPTPTTRVMTNVGFYVHA